MTMPAEFSHLVLTRFNIAIGCASSELRLDSAWLRGRVSLFERFCLPSIAGQQGARFRWLVFVDEESPGWFKDKIASYRSLVTPLYIEGPATDTVLARRVAESGLVSSRYLITTRLDNDDALSRNHLATVQRAFRHQDREFLAFPFGLQWFRGHLYNVCWPTNPFLSLIEKVQEGNRFTTAFCVPHDRVREVESVRLLLRSPQWLQVLHSSNIFNSLRGMPRLVSRSHANFNVSWSGGDTDDSLMARLAFSASAYGGRANRLAQKAMGRLLYSTPPRI
jgi:hypothetical protein